PPQPAAASSEIAGDIDGAGCVEFTQHGQCEIAVVAIAVVEREAGKAPLEMTLAQSPVHLVHGDDVDILGPQMRHHGAQELGRDFEMPVRLERGSEGGANMKEQE